MPSLNEVGVFWKAVLDQVAAHVSRAQFDTWFTRTTCRTRDDSGIVVEVPNTFYAEWLGRQYTQTVCAAVEHVLDGSCPRITFVAAENSRPVAEPVRDLPPDRIETAAGVPREVPAELPAQEVPSPVLVHLNPEYTFENFVVGPSNRLAHAAALAVIESQARVYNPLFIHGGLGLGKTHVLQGICHALLARRPNLRMRYIPCEQFINEFISAIERNGVEGFRSRYRRLDVLLIDDIHFLANKDHTQEEFFHTFNTLYNDRKQIILSSDSAPREIPTLEDRLVSRFKWGLVCEIEAPTFETRMAIVRKKGLKYGVDIADDVTEFLASSIRTNVREIEGAVTRVVGFASIMKRPLNLDTAKAALGDLVGHARKRVTVDEIVARVTEHYGVRLSDLQSKKRLQSITLPRQVCMYLARKFTPLSLAEIGGYFGGRDHSTVLYATERIGQRVGNDPELKATVHDLCRHFES